MSRYQNFDDTQAPLAFRLRLPTDDRQPPLMMLHGLGGDEQAMWGLESALPSGGMVVAPRGLFEQSQGGYAWNPEIRAWPPLVSEFADSVSALETLLEYLATEFGLRRERLILMGFSNGAAMALAGAMSPMSIQPAGIVAAAGHLPQGDLDLLQGIPIYWGHGIRDTFIPIEAARADVVRLEAAGVEVTYCEADVGHKLGGECLRQLRSWIAGNFPRAELSSERPVQGLSS